jgi:pyrroline-5-carboxylate reductase
VEQNGYNSVNLYNVGDSTVNFGFIGFGSMAKMLIRSLIEYSGVRPDNILVTRKSKDRLSEVGTTFNGVKVFGNCSEIVKNSRIVFLCVKPAEIREVLLEIASHITDNNHIVSLVGTVAMSNLQSVIRGKISKMMPSITSETGSGIFLVCHNECVTDEDAAFLNESITSFGKMKLVADKDIGFTAELTSCAPGFFASTFSHFVNAALKHTSSFDLNEITEMVIETLYATAKLLINSNLSFDQIIERVATKGGITEEGVIVLGENLPGVFDELFEKTLKKRRSVELMINDDFLNNGELSKSIYAPIQVDREGLTLMGVSFPNPEMLESTANAVGSNMFEGFIPTRKQIEIIRNYCLGEITFDNLIDVAREKSYE